MIFRYIVECKDKKQSLGFNKKKSIKTLGWDYYELLIMLTIMSNCTNQEKSLGKIIKECSLEPNWCTRESWAILNSHDSPWLKLGRSHRSPPSSIIYSIAHFKSYNNMTMFFKTPIPILKIAKSWISPFGGSWFSLHIQFEIFQMKNYSSWEKLPKNLSRIFNGIALILLLHDSGMESYFESFVLDLSNGHNLCYESLFWEMWSHLM